MDQRQIQGVNQPIEARSGSQETLLSQEGSPASSPLGCLYTTTPSREEAYRLGRTLVEEGLIACANILENMHAIYRWEGSVETAEESVLICKTSTSLVAAVAQRLKDLHSYECPCILLLSVQAADPAFSQWVDANVKTPTAPESFSHSE